MFLNLPFNIFLDRKFNLKLSELQIVAWNTGVKQTEQHHHEAFIQQAEQIQPNSNRMALQTQKHTKWACLNWKMNFRSRAPIKLTFISFNDALRSRLSVLANSLL